MQQQSLSLPTLTLVQETEINANYNQQLSKRWTATGELTAIESATLVKQKDRWLAEREYYHDQFLYTDRI